MTCLYAPDAPHRDPHHGRRKSHRADMFDNFVIATDQNPVGRRMRELRFRSLHLKTEIPGIGRPRAPVPGSFSDERFPRRRNQGDFIKRRWSMGWEKIQAGRGGSMNHGIGTRLGKAGIVFIFLLAFAAFAFWAPNANAQSQY